MTDNEKISLVKALVLNDARATTEVVTTYLAVAKAAVLNRLYPHGIPDEVTEVPERYGYTQSKLAARYFFRRGAEGEVRHDENGVNVTYASPNDEDILSEILPYARVIG